jgi:hypothetical protein
MRRINTVPNSKPKAILGTLLPIAANVVGSLIAKAEAKKAKNKADASQWQMDSANQLQGDTDALRNYNAYGNNTQSYFKAGGKIEPDKMGVKPKPQPSADISSPKVDYANSTLKVTGNGPSGAPEYTTRSDKGYTYEKIDGHWIATNKTSGRMFNISDNKKYASSIAKLESGDMSETKTSTATTKPSVNKTATTSTAKKINTVPAVVTSTAPKGGGFDSSIPGNPNPNMRQPTSTLGSFPGGMPVKWNKDGSAAGSYSPKQKDDNDYKKADNKQHNPATNNPSFPSNLPESQRTAGSSKSSTTTKQKDDNDYKQADNKMHNPAMHTPEPVKINKQKDDNDYRKASGRINNGVVDKYPLNYDLHKSNGGRKEKDDNDYRPAKFDKLYPVNIGDSKEHNPNLKGQYIPELQPGSEEYDMYGNPPDTNVRKGINKRPLTKAAIKHMINKMPTGYLTYKQKFAHGGYMRYRMAGGGSLNMLSSDTGVINGPSHAGGGVDLGNVEVEGKEVMKQNPDGSANVYSDKLGFADMVKPLAARKGQLEKIISILNQQASTLQSASVTDSPERNTVSRRLQSIKVQLLPAQEELAAIDAQMQQVFEQQQQLNGGQSVGVDGQPNQEAQPAAPSTMEPQMAYGGKMKLPVPTNNFSSESTSTAPKIIPSKSRMVAKDYSVKTPSVPLSKGTYTPTITGTKIPAKVDPVTQYKLDYAKKYGRPLPASGAIELDYTPEKIAAAALLPSTMGAMGATNKIAMEVGDAAIEMAGGVSGWKGEGIAPIVAKLARNKAVTAGAEMRYGGKMIKAGGGIKFTPGMSDVSEEDVNALRGKGYTTTFSNKDVKSIAGEYAPTNLGTDMNGSGMMGGSDSSFGGAPSPTSFGIGKALNDVAPFASNVANYFLTKATPQVPAPIMKRAPRIDTTVDNSADIVNTNNAFDSANAYSRNYMSGNPAGDFGANAARRINSLNGINQNKRNEERQLINRQIELNANTTNSNIDTINAHQVERNKVEAGKLNDLSANFSNVSDKMEQNRQYHAKETQEADWLDLERAKYGNAALYDKYIAQYDNEADFIAAMRKDTPTLNAKGEEQLSRLYRNRKSTSKRG